VIGYTQLNSVFYENGVLESEQVLTALDQRVRATLKQDHVDAESQDGMDIGLCVYDLAQKILDFAGANLPLYIARDGQIFELKGDKYPIGGTQFEDKKYTGNLVRVQPGDMVYIFSDGYADQFGGEPERPRKLSRKRFKEILLECHHLPAPKQQAHLERSYYEWRGPNEQLDDIMVIGFRIA
jgi:serine phosphatase RsbU (regulator of sigma subunit)